MPTGDSGLQHHQERVYTGDHDYRAGSPHLKHRRLNEEILARLRALLAALAARGLPPTVLEVGAGDGAFAEPLLAYGCHYTATEMSRPSIARLERLYARNERFAAVFDPDGTMGRLGEERFSLVLFASVLHHIPDYLAALDRAARERVAPGGALATVQDPLFYPRLGRARHALSEAAFLSWRVSQGHLARGAATRLRRARGVRDEDNPSDMVEYHVVRDGVDEEAVVALLRPSFARVELWPYWSTTAGLWQRVGELTGARNTFGVVAEDRLAAPPAPAGAADAAPRELAR
ncbi:MAG TPA: class I SAM-dependent methyltransferase [Solirubrobacteraceae bacterium]